MEYGEERQLIVAFRNGLESILSLWRECGENSTDAYGKCVAGMHTLSHLASKMRRNGGRSFMAGLIVENLLVDSVPRPVQSLVLTALARWEHDANPGLCPLLKGRTVSWFGRVLELVAQNQAPACVRWFEDMGRGIAVEGGGQHCWILPPQPIRMLRGLLFGTKPGSNGMVWFWQQAANSTNFPDQIFTDPGDFDRRACYLTEQHVRQLAAFFSAAPEVAVQRFGNVLRTIVGSMNCITYAQVRCRGTLFERSFCCSEGELSLEMFPELTLSDLTLMEGDDVIVWSVEVPDEKRPLILKAILASVEGRRRELIGGVFFPTK
ncbi:hypothetical protein COY93_00715 [Candidatus Uhrbacteria bacterium CG_4_10_14_0_8_um_filter_58_22]|uniref:Uncharacterized protein n=1 Tax=Candidatus Uhrbacteria bacterium CG_4_10_14_0_8_um_filter_58_22 TaxID=1975029 RepID=A0A2M7QAY2_9BACT|nr:MAG: hypothetical protein COY93_00715 [Candidatus Uhrbacteria bacterium CG_4_10_14_0_8_um_filter_58_22]